MEGHCGSWAPGFPPCLKAYRETWVCKHLAWLACRAPSTQLLSGGTEPSPCFEERSKSHIILIKTELFCRHLSLQGCAQIATYAVNFRGAVLKSVAWSYLLKASVLKAGGCGEHCEKKCFCILIFLYTECIPNMRVTALWVGSKLSQWCCLCQQG